MLKTTSIKSIDADTVLMMGCDRSLFFLLTSLSSCFAFAGFNGYWYMVGVGVAFQIIGIYALRIMGKADPNMFNIYMQTRKLNNYYPAETSPFREDKPGFLDRLMGGIK